MTGAVILVRHAATTANERRVIQGRRIDLPLSELGRRQAERLAIELRSHAPTRVFSSPLNRARETAGIVAGPAALDVEINAHLIERDFRDLEGLTRDQLLSRREAEGMSNLDPTGDFSARPDLVETHDEVTFRWQGFLGSIESRLINGETIAVVTHGGVIRAAWYSTFGIVPGYPSAIKIREASFLRLRRIDRQHFELNALWNNVIATHKENGALVS